MADGARAPVTPAVAAKQEAWEQQHAALEAPHYRITLKSRRDDLKSYNHGKRPDGEVFYTADQVRDLIPALSRQNARGYDIYVTPIDPAHHYIVVDDMRGGALDQLRADGYRPALVQESSADNRQAIIKIPRQENEQSEANELVQELNQRYGDEKFSGVIHPFRVAGFSNKKPDRQNAFTRIIEAAGGICEKAARWLDELREQRRIRAAEEEQRIETFRRSRAIETYTPPAAGARGRDADSAFRAHAQRTLAWVDKRGLERDWSRIDYQAVAGMLKDGWSQSETADALLRCSPAIRTAGGGLDLADKHKPEDYAQRTVAAAMSDETVRAAHEKASEQAQRRERQRGLDFSR